MLCGKSCASRLTQTKAATLRTSARSPTPRGSGGNLLKKEGQAAPSSTEAEAGPQTEQHKEEAPGTELAKPEDIPPPPPELPLAKVDAAAAHCSFCAAASPVFRVNCEALLLIYNGLGGETEVWVAFKPWVWEHRGDWHRLYYCVTWEQCSKRGARAP